MSEQNDSGQERSEQPTQKRLQESKDKGEVARSRELNTAAIMISGCLGLLFMGPGMAESIKQLSREILQIKVYNTDKLYYDFIGFILQAALALTPFMVFMMVVVLATPALIGGFSFSLQAAQPKLERINVLKGLQRMVSMKALIELVKAVAKFILITAITVGLGYHLMPEIMQLTHEQIDQGVVHGFRIMFWVIIPLSCGLLLIAAIDVPFQLFTHHKKLRMTLQEVKDEMKQTEGNPELKGRMRGLARDIAQRKMLRDVPDADVIIVNPTHYSVALKYHRNMKGAPMVIASGIDHMALHIREVAKAHQVAVFSAPPLARALYYNTEVGREIPDVLYVAVAKVLAYVFQLQTASRYGRGQQPTMPTDLPVPDELIPSEHRTADHPAEPAAE